MEDTQALLEISRKISLAELLDAKEKRSKTQRRLLKTFGKTLVCLLVNYVGEVKADKNTKIIFEEGFSAIKNLIEPIYVAQNFFATGEEGFFVTDLDAKKAKRLLCDLEQTHILGRLFDVDVFDADGVQIGREELGLPPRKCFVCERVARECYVARRHDKAQLKEFTEQKIAQFVLQKQKEINSKD